MPGIATKSKQIGSVTFNVTTFGALEGRTILARLVNMIGPVVRSFKSVADDIAEDREVDKAGVMIDAIAEAATNLPPKEFGALCDTFARTTEVQYDDGRALPLAGIFDAHFAANYMEMTMWFAFVLEVNFGNFFEGPAVAQVLASLTKRQAKSAKASGSPTASSGGNGDS